MNNIKKLRNEIGISLRELESYTGIASATINRLELEKRPLKEGHMIILSVFFSVTVDYLLGKSSFGYKIFPESSNNEVDCFFLSEKQYIEALIRNDIRTKIIKENDNYVLLRKIKDEAVARIQFARNQDIPGDSTKRLQLNRLNKVISRLNNANLDIVESFVMDLFISQKEKSE
ncbi:MAG: helix-turn-helix domain-containing protein [Bacilli bacterium]|jgi:transcriptional regulator with XRE-family HTH domain|nr:helix-turn-helix domain-containing protein [Bacilli bacterium]MCH4236029.1 helix-turn-helix domain-containing protein [Bacilli bacterium]